MSNNKKAVPPQQRTRNELGQFVAGNKASKGAGGRPKLKEEFKKFAQEKSIEALKVVYGLMLDENTKPGDRTYAARLIMEYGYGKPSRELDRERLDLDRQVAEAQIKRMEREAEDEKAISVTVAFDSLTEDKGWAK